MSALKTNRGLDWHYDIAGKGDPIVFIHGFGASGRWWQAQTEFLRDGYETVVIDLPGHGASGWMPVTLNDMAVDLRQIINGLGFFQFNIVASSFGALIALELHRLMPEAVMRISFVGSIPKFARGPSYPAGLDIERIRTLSKQFDGDYASILDIFFRSLFTMRERDSERFKWIKDLRANEPLPRREALKCFLDILEKADLRDRISGVVCPVQFITGNEDHICPQPIMDWVGEHFPNARFDVMDGCGHLPFLTKPDEYNNLLEDFLIK